MTNINWAKELNKLGNIFQMLKLTLKMSLPYFPTTLGETTIRGSG